MLTSILPILNALIAIAGEIPSLVKAGQTVVMLLEQNRDPTPEEQAQFDQALLDVVNNIPKE